MIKLTKQQIESIEEFGVVQEQYGLAPVSARVNALLTVADNTDLSFEEIRETLKLSKSSASNAINNLLSLNRIGYKTKIGDRKRYFHSRLDHWQESFRTDVLRLTDYNAAIEKIVKNRTKFTEEYNTKLWEHVRFMEYFVKESIKIIDAWEDIGK